jgi:hypothetical protein
VLDHAEFVLDQPEPVLGSEADVRRFAGKPMELLPSEFVELNFEFPGYGAFSFEGREYLRPIYDSDDQLQLVVSGRQCEKSTLRGDQCIHFAVTYPGIREMYVTPSDRQTKDFSFERLRSPLLDSPKLARYIKSSQDLSVYDPVLTIGKSTSVISLRSCFLHADRVRGRRADVLFIDELQDILAENIPVIEQCVFHGRPDLKLIYYSGTPKTFDNPLETMWSQSSTMTELMFPCRHHGLPGEPWTWHWFHITHECLGDKGLICPKCGKPVQWNDPNAVWVDTATNAADRDKRPVKAYHIPQPVTPMAHDPEGKAWRILKRQQKEYPAYRFFNEVMGVSYDFGKRPLTPAELARCCYPAWEMRPDQLTHMMQLSGEYPVYAGIDWGGEEYAYTVIALGTYALSPDPNRFFQFYWHRFSGKETSREEQLEQLYNLIKAFRVRYTVADYGMGYYENDWLVRRLGARKFAKMQYLGKQQGKIVWRPKIGWFTAYKSAVVQDYLAAIKKEKIVFPAWSSFGDPFGQDMLNLRGEWNERRQEMMWGHGAQQAVDSFHASLYCLTASLRDHPRPDITHLTVDDTIVDPEALGEEVPFRQV